MKRMRIFRLLGVFAVLLVASCGQVSLLNLMEVEEPGDFSVQPGVATLVEAAKVDILAQGGFRPYGPLTLTGVGTLVDGVYTAPGVVGPFGETVTIEAEDAFGTPGVSRLKIFARLHVNEEEVALLDSDEFGFWAWGGQGPYDYYLDGVLQAENFPLFVDWTFPASPAGLYSVEVEDNQGMRIAATVTVVASNPTVLAISPTEAVTTPGGAPVDFVVAVPASHGYAVTTDLGSVAIVPMTTPTTWRYTPPSAAAGTATVTLTDTDTSEAVTATVEVLELTPTGEPLAISPAALGGDLAPGEQVVFTASGGTPGVDPLPMYTFAIDPDELMGLLEPVPDHPDKVRYTAVTGTNNLDWLRLTDAVGGSVRVKIKSKL